MYKRTIEKIRDSGYAENYTSSDWLKLSAYFANTIRVRRLCGNYNLDMEIGYFGYCTISALILMNQDEKLLKLRKWVNNADNIDDDLCRFAELSVVFNDKNDSYNSSLKIYSSLSIVHRYCKDKNLDFEELVAKAMRWGGGVIFLQTTDGNLHD